MQTLQDQYGRQFHYLRLSVTEACNFRCVYCLPNGYRKCPATAAPLRIDEIRNLISGLSELGMRKVRITGGEPTVRRDLVEILQTISGIRGVSKVALSTNGGSLKNQLRAYKEAGVSALNISVDSLDREIFRQVSGQDRLTEVLEGIDGALAVGFDSVKINTVLLKTKNADQIEGFLSYVKSRPVAVRFIELMRTGDNGAFFQENHFSASALRDRLESSGWIPVLRGPDDGPAVEFKNPAYQGRIGLIAPYSKDFCKSCNRIRVSSQGDLRLCLFGQGQQSLRPLLQSPDQKEELLETVTRLIGYKPYSHLLDQDNPGSTRRLAEIGG